MKIEESGITSYWYNGEYIILYDPEIWYTWTDSEEHKIHLCLQKNMKVKTGSKK